jgi:phosphatidate cytidylyltransferase
LLVAVVAWAAIRGGLVFLVLLDLILAGAALELIALTGLRPALWHRVALVALALMPGWLWVTGTALELGLGLTVLGALVLALVTAPHDGLRSAGAHLLVVAYVGWLGGLLVGLRWEDPASPGENTILFTFVVLWTSDTVAYLVGRKFGQHKLTPRLSPGKSVEGLVSGFVGAWLVAGLWCFAVPGAATLAYWWGLATLLAAVGFVGDLFESGLKRAAGVKDTSNVIPGHGGLLDRFDSALFAAPALACWRAWLGVPG